MFIPKEALWSSLIGKGRKTLIENTRADQVAETTGIRATLSGTAEERQRNFKNDDAPTERRERRRSNRPEETGITHDRRKKQVPVLLDTRTGERRGRLFGQPAIDFEI